MNCDPERVCDADEQGDRDQDLTVFHRCFLIFGCAIDYYGDASTRFGCSLGPGALCNRLAPSGLLSINTPLIIHLHPDRALVEAVLAEVPGAFERLVGEYHGLCWSIAYRMVRSSEDAHDLCQETFLRVHQNLYQYRFECPLKNWIGRVAYSIALRQLKRAKSALGAEIQSGVALLQPEDEVENVDHAAGYDQETDTRRLRRAIQSLPVLQRSILSMYHFDDMSIPEISQVTGLATGTIKSHLFRSRLRLKELLEPGVTR